MKLKSKILLLLLAISPLMMQAGDYRKNVHQGFVKSQITALDITNKFGTIEINDLGGDSVTVDATITVEALNEAKANQLLDLIKINIRKNGGLLDVETVITQDFKTKQNFSIDYRINIPRDRNLMVSNKFGNVVLNQLEGKGTFRIEYGNLTSGTLNVPAGSDFRLEMSYGKADMESVNHLNGEIKYSKIFIGEAGQTTLDSRYSVLNIQKTDKLQLDSKYDGANLDEINSLIAVSKYTNYKIGKLKSELNLQTEYGSVRVDQVDTNFNRIEITNNYGGITLGLQDAAYFLNANCEYCDVNYPADKFKGNRAKENTHLKVEGTVGDPGNTRQVIINSKYGSVKLTQ